MSVHFNESGPIFNGEWFRIMNKITEETEKESADFAYDQIEARLPHVLQHPTGRFQSSIGVHSDGPDGSVVDDGGIIYGHWLEGTGSRNFPKTRFKGYFTFRLIKQKMEKEIVRIAQLVYDRHKEGLGG